MQSAWFKTSVFQETPAQVASWMTGEIADERMK